MCRCTLHPEKVLEAVIEVSNVNAAFGDKDSKQQVSGDPNIPGPSLHLLEAVPSLSNRQNLGRACHPICFNLLMHVSAGPDCT